MTYKDIIVQKYSGQFGDTIKDLISKGVAYIAFGSFRGDNQCYAQRDDNAPDVPFSKLEPDAHDILRAYLAEHPEAENSATLEFSSAHGWFRIRSTNHIPTPNDAVYQIADGVEIYPHRLEEN